MPKSPSDAQSLFSRLVDAGLPVAPMKWEELHPDWQAAWARVCLAYRENPKGGEHLFKLCVVERIPLAPATWAELHPEWQATWERISDDFAHEWSPALA